MEKLAKLNKIKAAFKANPSELQFLVTSDGNCFKRQGDARLHARKLEDSALEIYSMDRLKKEFEAESMLQKDAEKAEAKAKEDAAEAEAKAKENAEKAEAKAKEDAEKAEAKAKEEAAKAEAKAKEDAEKAEADQAKGSTGGAKGTGKTKEKTKK